MSVCIIESLFRLRSISTNFHSNMICLNTVYSYCVSFQELHETFKLHCISVM